MWKFASYELAGSCIRSKGPCTASASSTITHTGTGRRCESTRGAESIEESLRDTMNSDWIRKQQLRFSVRRRRGGLNFRPLEVASELLLACIRDSEYVRVEYRPVKMIRSYLLAILTIVSAAAAQTFEINGQSPQPAQKAHAKFAKGGF